MNSFPEEKNPNLLQVIFFGTNAIDQTNQIINQKKIENDHTV